MCLDNSNIRVLSGQIYLIKRSAVKYINSLKGVCAFFDLNYITP